MHLRTRTLHALVALLFVSSLFGARAHAAPTVPGSIVNVKNSTQFSGSGITHSVPVDVTPGNTLVFYVLWFSPSGTATLNTVTALGEPLSLLHNPTLNPDGTSAAAAYRFNSVGGNGLVSATFSADVTSIIGIVEVSGVVDLFSTALNPQYNVPLTANAVTSGNISTSGASGLLLGFTANVSGATAEYGTGFTGHFKSPHISIESKELLAAGTSAATFTSPSLFVSYNTLAVALKPLNPNEDPLWGEISTPGPSRILLNWAMPPGSDSSMYSGVLITGVQGQVAPTGIPTDGVAYSQGETVGWNGTAVVLPTGFSNTSATVENGDKTTILPGTEYTFKAFTSDPANNYSNGVASSSVTTPTSGGSFSWTYKTDATNLASPAPTGSGVVALGGNDSLLRAVSDATGVRKYTPSPTVGGAGYSVGAIQDRPTIIPAEFTQNPTCRNVCDVVYVGTGDGRVRAFRADTGIQLWASTTLTSGGGSIMGAPSVQLYDFSDAAYQASHATFDLVIVGTNNAGSATNNRVFGLNGSNGSVVFNYNRLQTLSPGIDKFLSAPFIDYASNSVWLTSYSNGGTQPSVHHISTLLSGNVDTAQPRITLSTGNKDVAVPPTVNDQSTFLYLATGGGDLVAINTATNAVATSTAVGGTPVGALLVFKANATEDWIIISTSTGVHKRTFNSSTLSFIGGWDALVPDPSAPVFSSYPEVSSVYVGGSDGNLYKISTTDGTFTTLSVNSGKVIGTPTFDQMNSKIIVGDSSGRIYSINAF